MVGTPFYALLGIGGLFLPNTLAFFGSIESSRPDVRYKVGVRNSAEDGTDGAVRVPTRTIVHGEALTWMAENAADPSAGVITSLPDVSERPDLDFDGWRSWFILAARRVIAWTPSRGAAIFFQSDVRHDGTIVDKSYLVMRAAEEEGASLLWHKIVCRRPPGTISFGRPSWSHMLCIGHEPRPPARRPGPDVLPDAGFMPWSRAMGVFACRVACTYLQEEIAARIIVDPFCGRGTVLAVANEMGLDAIGVELSAKRCKAARALVVAAGSA